MQPIDFFLRGARQHPEHTAVIDADTGRALSHSDLRDQALSLSTALQKLSGKKRPVVATLAGNSIEMLLGILATYACGGVLVPLTPTVVEKDIARQLAYANPDLILYDSVYEPLIQSYEGLRICNDTTGEFSVSHVLKQPAGALPERVHCGLEEIAAIKFTGGSSGAPKAVQQSFRCINTMVASLMMVYEFDSDERFLLAPPMTHGAGTFVLPILGVGGCLVIANKAKASLLHQIMDTHQITSTWVPPTLLQRLVEAQTSLHTFLPALRNLLYGGAPCSARLIEQAIDCFGPVLGVTYGLTEAPVIITGMPGILGSLPENRGSAGYIGPLTRVAVAGENGQPIEKPHTTGEIIATGDLLMSGYLDMPEQTADVIKNGWFHTGDIGHIDERGFLFIKGRSKDIIISGGFNVYPSDVEDAYLKHQAISECVVFGVPDEVWGERVEMAVVLNRTGALSQKDLIDFGKQELGSVRAPKKVHIVDSFTKNELGKVDKRRIVASLRDQDRLEEC
ncbi:acyl--CoA ligase [Alcaligenaceae bacterium]|nr:acyl--CoA ligase [Alcaligenaceae bacterium]